MADDDSRLEGIEIAFKSGAMPKEDIRLVGVWGRERISTPLRVRPRVHAAPAALHRRRDRRAPQGALRRRDRAEDGRRRARRAREHPPPRRRAHGRAPATAPSWCRTSGSSRSSRDEPPLPGHDGPRHRDEDPRAVRADRGHRLRRPREPHREEPRSASTSSSTRRATGTSSSAGWSTRATSTGSSTASAARSSSSRTTNEDATPIDDPAASATASATTSRPAAARPSGTSSSRSGASPRASPCHRLQLPDAERSRSS